MRGDGDVPHSPFAAGEALSVEEARIVIVLGSVDEVVVDCREPRQLAEFWAAVLGGEVGERDPDSCYISPPGWSQLSFQART